MDFNIEELEAELRQLEQGNDTGDPKAFTTREYAKEKGLTEGQARERIHKLWEAGRLETTQKLQLSMTGWKMLPAYRLKGRQ
jgi:hypothetical protein